MLTVERGRWKYETYVVNIQPNRDTPARAFVDSILGPELPFVQVSPQMMRHRRYLLALASFDRDEIEECELEGRSPRHPVEVG